MAVRKVFILDPYYEDAINVVKSAPNTEAIYRDDPQSQQWRSEADAIMIRSETVVTADDLDKAQKLKVVVKQGVGIDNIDLDAAKERGVIVCNTPALNSESVAELTIGLALCVARRVNELDRRIRRGEVIVRSDALGRSLFQKTIGIVGMGNIGKVMAQKWIAAMGGKAVAYDPVAPKDVWKGIEHRRAETLEELLRDSDVITLHVPLLASTRNMIGKAQFEIMKPTAILVNVARGGVVDETALLDALKSKKIYGVALDAMNIEPPTRQAYEKLLEHENIIMTPHIGANTIENQIISGKAVAETALAVLDGKEVPNRLV